MCIKKLFSVLVVSQLFFFVNSAYAWTLKMDFNEGPLGQPADRDTGASYHVFSDAAGHTYYSDCNDFSPSGHCAKMNIQKGHDGWGVWGGRITFSERGLTNPGFGDEVWISVKMYMPLGFDYTASPQLKFLRLHTRSQSERNEGYHDLTITPDGPSHWDGSKNSNAPYMFSKEKSGIGYVLFGDYATDKPRLGVWENYEMYIKLDHRAKNEGGTAIVRIYKNGKLLKEITNTRTLVSSASYADQFLIFTYWNGGKSNKTGMYPTKDQHLFIDDIIITTDRPAQRDSSGNPVIRNLVKLPNPPSSLSAVK